MDKKIGAGFLLWTLLIGICFEATALGWISVRDGRFTDESGRHVILHGINVGNKSAPYFTKDGPEDYARMRSWGFNCIRLLIFWAALEPQCGVYDEKYLAALDARVAWARDNGMWVLLDLHQDLWGEGKCRGDGAPAWATLDNGRPHASLGFVWSDAYLVSGAVQSAFDNFWANAPAPDGIGLQDHLARAWKLVAERYANEPAVVGYDLLNEPFIGSPILEAVASIMKPLAEVTRESPLNRKTLFAKFSDVALFRRVVDEAGPVFQQFEREKLGPYHQRMADAIRSVDSRHILFIEPSPSSNQGVPSALPPVLLPDGSPDPRQALAPHAYDIVTDGPTPEMADEGRLRFIFDRHMETARRLNMPMLLGEWGAFYGSPRVLPAARAVQRQIERTLCSDTYWDSHDKIDQTVYLETLERPYPMAVAGILCEYAFDHETGVFTCAWEEDPSQGQSSIMFLPARRFANAEAPFPDARIEPIATGTSNLILTIPAGNEKRRRDIRLSAPAR
ncbi:MAG TPA: cellulase family glycosylhydrolase [Candidatus Hydrogenedentes bacterium]|nr:cellulase family glycosylhydrolase [Candidatus Hydrogenedentota bacterium]HOV72468.1 cellulase family glycosylhydrolase [Candidatus Hydrogenedentota bacterium]